MTTKKIILAILLLAKISLAQNTIKVKKQLTQDKQTSVATIAGLYYGECGYTQFITNKKIKISNNKDRFHIIKFTATFIDKRTIKEFVNKGDSLCGELLTELNKYYTSQFNKKTRNYISPIVAFDKQTQDTVFFNPIEIKLYGQ